LRTELAIVSVSSGCSVRGSTTSTSSPSSASISAAASDSFTMREVATIVKFVPSRAIRALPSGTSYRSSGTTPCMPSCI
jgi:hypothetical protein